MKRFAVPDPKTEAEENEEELDVVQVETAVNKIGSYQSSAE